MVEDTAMIASGLEPPPEPAEDDLGSIWAPLKAGLLSIPAVLLLAPVGVALHLAGLVSGKAAMQATLIAAILLPSFLTVWRQRRSLRQMRDRRGACREWERLERKARLRRHGLKSGVVFLPLMLPIFVQGVSTDWTAPGWTHRLAPVCVGLIACAEVWDILGCVRRNGRSLTDFERSSDLDAAACAAVALLATGVLLFTVDRVWHPISSPVLFVCLLLVAMIVRRGRLLVIDRRRGVWGRLAPAGRGQSPRLPFG